MKVLVLLAGLLALSQKECSPKLGSNGLPGCVQEKIDAIKGQPRWNPPAQVDEYTYKGKTVYLFSADCCDQYTTLYDAQCNIICAPSGGMTGKGDRKCTDFNEMAKHVRMVWKDDR